MAALTAEAQRQSKANALQRTLVGKIAANVKCFKGGLAAKNAAGYVLPASDTAGLVVIGVFMETIDNTGGANAAYTIRITTGVFKFFNLVARPVVQANQFGLVRVGDDTSVATTGGVADIIAGFCDQIDSDGVWVHVDGSINVALAS